MRNLVICTDGTWNKPDQIDRDRLTPSNVIKIARAVDENCTEIKQIRYYDSGVGTAGWLDKIRGGITGRGLFKNMRDAYAWLIETHKPGIGKLYIIYIMRTIRQTFLVNRAGKCRPD